MNDKQLHPEHTDAELAEIKKRTIGSLPGDERVGPRPELSRG
jgi:hypothetical protein